jgi:two-component system, NtrC family, nitrogen regulation sensor histidine kinase NtrY
VSFRRKLLAVFALTVFVSVATVALILSALTRQASEKSEEERTTALVAQFQREFDQRGQEISRRVATIAASDAATRIAFSFNSSKDYAPFLGEARSIAESQQLDFLEFVDNHGTIISSAQWPAKYGYADKSLPLAQLPPDAFLKKEDLPEGQALGLFSIARVNATDSSIYVIGGRRLDKEFIAGLELPAGMRAMFYENFQSGFSPQALIDPSGTVKDPQKLSDFIQQVLEQKSESTALIHWTGNAADDEALHAIPLNDPNHQVAGILLVGSSRGQYVELRQHIRSATLFAGGAGLLLAILLSGWAATRVTKPVEQLAQAAREVAAGNWDTQVNVGSSDEISELAESFNHMTQELLAQRENLVRAERIAAWKELARRLAHELKNPLFPLQLTVENLVRAREQSPELFEEIFHESATTLLTEITNLKAIISRFSDFSKMPQPQFQPIQVNDLLRDVLKLFQAQLQAPGKNPIQCTLKLEDVGQAAADPELLHRVFSNLLLNAIEAMPQGGILTVATSPKENDVVIEVHDTGKGLSPEECERLFTPYYTSKTHGTGLGLAIVQSVIHDHGGTIGVKSGPGQGATFTITLPRNLDKLQQGAKDVHA